MASTLKNSADAKTLEAFVFIMQLKTS